MSDALLDEIRERRTSAESEWQEIKDEAKKDRLCIAGDPWEALDPEGKKQRKAAKRPLVALDELGQYINQTVNDVRANPRGIKFAPTGNGANDKGAEFYQNHTREIEYRSHAKVGFSNAFDNCVSASYGWVRVRTKREHIRTFNQDIWIDPVMNPDQVLPDPNAVWPDSRDITFLYYIEAWAEGEYTRKFPKAKIKSFAGWQKTASGWLKPGTVDVAEYWRLETFKRRLVAFQRKGIDPRTGRRFLPESALVDELPGGRLPAGADNIRDEQVDDTRVESYLTNGIEILEQNDWKGKYIPFVSCFGKILYVDEGGGPKRKILSMTRLARDPYLLYCYYRTTEAELVGMTPKFPYFAYEGQLSPPELLNLQKSLHEPVAVIRVKPTVDGAPPGTVLAFPQRQPYEPPIQGLEIGAEAARRAIQAAMGTSPMPTDAQRNNQKSGKFLEKMDASMQKGSFHFVDHYELMIERTGVIIEDLMDKVMDTKREVPVRDKQDSASLTVINDPSDPQSVHTKGDYRVTISTGPADASQRDAADTFVDAMVSNIAVIAQIAGPQKAAQILGKSVKLKQLGPIGDEIAELIEPPAMTGKDGKPLPPEAQMLMGEIQNLQSQLQEASKIIETEEVKAKQQKDLKAMDIEFQREKLHVDSEVKVVVANISAKVDKMQLMLAEVQRLSQHLEGDRGRAHDLALSDMEHRQALEQGQQGHQQALEQGAQGHQQALEQGDQGVAGQLAVQAAAPPPANGASA